MRKYLVLFSFILMMSFSFDSKAMTETEPNNTKATANYVSLNDTVSGLFGYEDETYDAKDYYSFSVTDGSAYKITVKAGIESIKNSTTILYLYNASGQYDSISYTMENNYDDKGSYYYTFEADASGTAYFVFDNYNETPYTYSFVITSGEQSVGSVIKDSDGNYYTVTSSREVSFKKPAGTKKTYYSVSDSITVDNIEYDVTGISDNAFKNCSRAKNIYLPSDTKTIGKNAFYGCKKLTSITMPTYLKKIGKNAFKNCKKLEYVHMSSSKKISSIGKNAFKNTKKDITFYLPKSKKNKYVKLLKKSGISNLKYYAFRWYGIM